MRKQLFRLSFVAASLMTLLFVCSMLFWFGIGVNRDDTLTWRQMGGTDKGNFNVFCYAGTFRLYFDVSAVDPAFAQNPMSWRAGAMWNPRVLLNATMSDRLLDKIGLNGTLLFSGPYAGYGEVCVFGLYPAALLWLTTWFLRPARALRINACRQCGYDLRATPHRCPECGAVPVS